MPDPAYRVAREVARSVAAEHGLTPPFDLERLAGAYALVLDESLPTPADAIVLHAATPGERPRIAVDAGLHTSPQRRRFAIAHALGHVLLGWHPLGAPCDVSTPPTELPATVHDLVEGEANAFARELLLPTEWVRSLGASGERVAERIRQVGELAGVPVMPAARAVAMQLDAGYVWVVTDQWHRVLDAGRSPRTQVRPPIVGEEVDAGSYTRHAAERQRVELDGCTLSVWRFEPAATLLVPHDRSSRDLVGVIAADLGLDETGAVELAARVDGAAGWANEHAGAASLDGMERALRERLQHLPELTALSQHPAYGELVGAKATELVAKRLAR